MLLYSKNLLLLYLSLIVMLLLLSLSLFIYLQLLYFHTNELMKIYSEKNSISLQ